MEVVTQQTVAVVEASQPAEARRTVRTLADRLGFDEADSYRAGLVATELATNLVKFATRGEIVVRAAVETVPTIEILSIDRGPGLADVPAALSDGHSTAGTSGNGLGAVKRLSDDFDMYSSAPGGTVVFASLRARRMPVAAGRRDFQVSGICVPKAGEDECGDAWIARRRIDGTLICVADGLGHGHFAAAAAAAAIDAFRSVSAADCSTTLGAIHAAARPTRGAAAAIAEVSTDRGVVKFAGVGNVAGAIVTNGSIRHMVSNNGTLGHDMRVVREYSYPWSDIAVLVMHSDGLVSHWSLDRYRGLVARHPAVIAAVLYRDFTRGRDDVTVVVGRQMP